MLYECCQAHGRKNNGIFVRTSSSAAVAMGAVCPSAAPAWSGGLVAWALGCAMSVGTISTNCNEGRKDGDVLYERVVKGTWSSAASAGCCPRGRRVVGSRLPPNRQSLVSNLIGQSARAGERLGKTWQNLGCTFELGLIQYPTNHSSFPQECAVFRNRTRGCFPPLPTNP